MPLYVFECQRCGKKQDEFRSVEDRDRPGDCSCWPGARTCRLEVGPPPRVRGEKASYYPYHSVAMGAVDEADRLPGEEYNADGDVKVTSRSHRAGLMRKLDMVDR